MIKMIAVALLSGTFLGFIGGAITAFEFYHVRALSSQVRYLKEDRARYRKSLGFSEGLEKEDADTNISNEEIIRAILAKAARPASEKVAEGGTADHRVCADVDGVLQLGQLR